MRIAVGVLLIVASLFHGCAGAGLTILGGATSVVGEAANEAMEQEQQRAAMAVAEGDEAAQAQAIQNAAEIEAAAETVSQAGGLLAVFGIFLLVLFGLEIAAAVCLFISKAPMFILVVGALGLALPIIGLVAGGEINVMTIAPVVISVLAIVAALSLKKELSGGTAAMAPPVA